MSAEEHSDDEYDQEENQFMPPRRFLRVDAYLELLQTAALTPAQKWRGTPPRLTMVMGNPSADLDSIVSAILFSYFHNSGIRGESPMFGAREISKREDSSRRMYLSLINMPRTSLHDLRRLRPELGVALRAAFTAGRTDSQDDQDEVEWAQDDPEDVETYMCSRLVTIYDLVNTEAAFQNFKNRFEESQGGGKAGEPEDKQDLVLVDHNAPSIPSLSSDHISRQFSVTGCIDHHVDENLSPEVKPRIIRTGIGSCVSLVVNYLRESNLWPDITKHVFHADTNMYGDSTSSSDLNQEDISALRQVSTLALAPILIDTSNLTAVSKKCSDVDREAVSFLESQIAHSASASAASTEPQWNRNKFYDEISDAKTNSLDLLTMPEIFDRDYKQWNDEVTIGISSIIKPISWLLQVPCKGKPADLVEHMTTFANNDFHHLGVFVFSTRGIQDKAKELCAVGFNDNGVKTIEAFERKAKDELGLEDWDGNEDLRKQMEERFADTRWRLWWMKDFTKTRKQVAPLMREAVKNR
jgi:exopolyphosphatase